MDYKKIPHNKTILVVNASWEPLNLTSGRRAIVLVLKDKAHVITSRTIRLKHQVRLPYSKTRVGKPTRSLILKRDGHTCQYCGYTGPKLTIDHVIPKSRGGDESWQNLAASCLDCNNCKDNRTPEEWASALKRIFNKETTNMSALPFSWTAHQIGMLEYRVMTRDTTLAEKPRAPFNKITVTISTAEVEEWKNYIYS